MSYDLGQTFYVDKAAVQNAEMCFVTSVGLFFKSKPVQGKTVSGLESPGVTVALCSVKEDGTPNIGSSPIDIARKEYADISVSATGSTETTFIFAKPICIDTNRTYCFLIAFDGNDTDYEIFANKAGKLAVSSTSISQVSSGIVDGNAYKITNGNVLTPLTDTDITFKVKVAKFTELTQTIKINNRPYEFLTVSGVTGTFKGGEEVYGYGTGVGNVTITQTTSLVGDGTNFTAQLSVGDKIKIESANGDLVNIRVVNSITNTTHLVMDRPGSFIDSEATCNTAPTGILYEYDPINDLMVIQDSDSISDNYRNWGDSGIIIGVDSRASADITSVANTRVNNIIPNYTATTPPQTSLSLTANFANTSGGVSSTRKVTAKLGKRVFINTYDAMLASRTREVKAATPFKSFEGELVLTTSNPYSSPFVRENDLDLFVERYSVNNNTANESSNRGSASARYIGNQVTLTNNQFAEDMKIYLKAFKPSNTDIKVYVKFYNTTDIESFDMKSWTELSLNSTSVSITSNPSNIDDFKDLGFDVPFYPPGTQITGNFAVNANGLIEGSSGTVSSNVAVGDVVRVYHPANASIYVVDSVVATNSSSLTLSRGISNTTITNLQSGFYVDKATDKEVAFLDKQNFNTLTYFNSSLSKFKTYNAFAVKIVLLSSDNTNIPFVDDLQAVAVSA
jgi:hypothetical protein